MRKLMQDDEIVEVFQKLLEIIHQTKVQMRKAQLNFLEAGYGSNPQTTVMRASTAGTFVDGLGEMITELECCVSAYTELVKYLGEGELKNKLLALVNKDFFDCEDVD
jgi:hypothetical protein